MLGHKPLQAKGSYLHSIDELQRYAVESIEGLFDFNYQNDENHEGGAFDKSEFFK